MGKYVLKRLGYLLVVLIILSFLIFAVYNMLPVDKAADMAMQEIAANKHLIYAERYLYWQRRLWRQRLWCQWFFSYCSSAGKRIRVLGGSIGKAAQQACRPLRRR